ncbi:hypothetical protein [Pseudomonas sp. NPDC087626]|uniref:hypothetical protein n=1 Tax=Pseudomonas sp. NPDC087626 TaxID=3364444 RepID=UPI00380E61E0
MGLLFIFAVLLAWPTYGLSILLWFGLAVARGAFKRFAIRRREQARNLLMPLFPEDLGFFFSALDVPLVNGYHLTEEELRECGSHFVNYLSHNPSEAALFIKGLERWRTKGEVNLCNPVNAALDENHLEAKREIHLTAYRAIEALMTNNKNLKCFRKIDFGRVLEYRQRIEIEGLLNAN